MQLGRTCGSFHFQFSFETFYTSVTAFSIMQDKYIVREKPHLQHQEIRQKLSGNLRPLNCCGFLTIKLNVL